MKFFNLTLRRQFTAMVFLPLLLLLQGCGSDSDSSTDGQVGGSTEFTTTVINATAGGFGTPPTDPANKYTYFNLETGQVIDLSDDASKTSTDWHIAFKRTNTKLNGGVSGPGTTRGSVADAQDDFYDAGGNANPSVFLNATPDSESNAIRDFTDASTLSFKEDGFATRIISDGGSESWWSYNPVGHTVSANANAWNIVRGASGNSYAKFQVTDIVQASRDISLTLFIQGNTSTSFSVTPVTWIAAIGAGGGSKCYDFDTTSEVNCTTDAATWDIQVEVTPDGFGWNIWTNGGVRGDGSSGASFGTLNTADANAYAGASSVPGFFSDSTSGVFFESSWYAYNLQGGHKIWPNYRVYAIDIGAGKRYKMQIISYYDAGGTSGMINIRYAEL